MDKRYFCIASSRVVEDQWLSGNDLAVLCIGRGIPRLCLCAGLEHSLVYFFSILYAWFDELTTRTANLSVNPPYFTNPSF